MGIAHTSSELLGHPGALDGPQPRSLWHLGAALRLKAASAPRPNPSSVPLFAKFLPRPRRGRALQLFPLCFSPNNPRGTRGGIDTLYL